MVAHVPVDLRPGSVGIDAKFHSGMVEFSRRLQHPVACLLPERIGSTVEPSGAVDVPLDQLPYRLHVAPAPTRAPRAEADRVVEEIVRGAALAYIGPNGGLNRRVATACRRLGIPYVVLTELTHRTELEIMKATTSSALRRLARGLRLSLRVWSKRDLIAHAAEVHANGYPTFHELASLNPRRLLFFDTRARDEDVISEQDLQRRLDSRTDHPARLIFSGRYLPIKGTLDVVRAGVELHRLGMDFRLDLYGQGPLRESMVSLVRESGVEHKVFVHGSLPYKPDLVDATKLADLFLCCHIQGDPSCTYLETFACGVPIVGYSNEMWSPLCDASQGGTVVPRGDHVALARAVADLLGDDTRLRQASGQARRFALAHTMDVAWSARGSRLSALAVGQGRSAK